MKRQSSTAQLPLVYQGHLGLIVGPGVTLGPRVMIDLVETMAKTFSVSGDTSYLDTCQAAISAGASYDAVRTCVSTLVAECPPAPLSPRLARVRWGAVINFSPDMHLEDAIRAETAHKPFWPPGIVVDSPDTPIPPRAIPLLKPLGCLGRDSLVIDKYQYTRSRPRWRAALRVFLDLVKNAPVLCLGMAELSWALGDVLAELSALPIHVKQLVVLEDDPQVASEEIDRMLDPRTDLVVSSGTIGDLVQVVESGSLSIRPISPQRPELGDTESALRNFVDIAFPVTNHSSIKTEERQQLFEMLFAPTSLHWDPFIHNLDFRRTIGTEVVNEMDSVLRSKDCGDVIIVEGAAATGKTVLLKRVALELAAKNHLVLWLRPYFYPDVSSRISGLFKELSRAPRKAICIVQDDPYGLGSLSLRELGAAARGNGASVRFLVGVRSSEWSTREPADLLGSLRLQSQFQVSEFLDDEEWRRLPKYLEDLQIARDARDATAQVSAAASRSARDTLTMLFWLLPETRAHIQASIKEEYFRLGDQAGFRRVVLGQAAHSSELLKRAYEMVAVADKYRASIPIEVLVSALGVDYGAWLAATDKATGAWGLLYAEDNEEAETFVYRTRNDVVSSVLVDALNGGSLSRSGEVRTLRTLFDACNGTHPSYLEFCERVLAGNEALKQLEYEDGLLLFERALATLPHRSKTLLHHKGIWMRKKGHKPIEALKVFDEALVTTPSPYARRVEADEHIYTSSAAAVIDAIQEGHVNIETGKRQALLFLSRARSGSFFNASAVHVHANLALELAKRIGIETLDSKSLTATALADIDRTVLVLEANPTREVGEDINLLRVARDRIVEQAVDPDNARDQAMVLWNGHQNQDGFCLAARAFFHRARISDRGTAYNVAFEYCTNCIKLVTAAGAAPTASLHDARLLILYEWRIHAWRKRPKGGFIDWDTFHNDVVRAIASAGESPLYRYFEAIAHAHLGHWNEATAAFTHVRQARAPKDLLWARRDVLLDRDGNPRQLQGTVRHVNNRIFVHVEELGADFHADREHKWPKSGEIATCHVQFAFGGPTAIPTRV